MKFYTDKTLIGLRNQESENKTTLDMNQDKDVLFTNNHNTLMQPTHSAKIKRNVA